MNKKIIMLIGALFCGNSMMVASQKDIITSFMATGLAAEENKTYQALVAKYQSKKLSAEDNTLTNIGILNKKELFLVQAIEGSNKSSLWPHWLAASFGPVLSAFGYIGGNISNMSDYGTPAYSMGRFIASPAELPYDINDALGLPYGMLPKLIYTVAPLMA